MKWSDVLSKRNAIIFVALLILLAFILIMYLVTPKTTLKKILVLSFDEDDNNVKDENK